MGGNDPFRGIKLSDQAPRQGLEQRLFAPTTPKPPPEPQKPAEERPSNIKPPIPKPQPPKPAPARRISLLPASLASTAFSLDDEALYKASYVFTPQELEALEDLKLELKRELDSKITKNDLMRAALHMLVEDFQNNLTSSYIHKKLRKRYSGFHQRLERR